jgi:hypothetical protein
MHEVTGFREASGFRIGIPGKLPETWNLAVTKRGAAISSLAGRFFPKRTHKCQ